MVGCCASQRWERVRNGKVWPNDRPGLGVSVDEKTLTFIEAMTEAAPGPTHRIGGVYTASPVAADGKVYLVSEDGETIVLNAGRTPTIAARNKLNARQLASPAIAGGRLFIRADDMLYAIGK